MTSPEPNDPSQYMIEVLNLTRRLDAVTARHGFQRITSTLTQGRERYLDLVFRRLFLDFLPKDTAIVLWLLDVIQVRLAALERLRQKSLNAEGVTAVNHRIPAHRDHVRRARRAR